MRSVPSTEKLKNVIEAKELTVVNNQAGYPVLIILPLSDELQNICKSLDKRCQLETLVESWWRKIEQNCNSENQLSPEGNTSSDNTPSETTPVPSPPSPATTIVTELPNPGIPAEPEIHSQPKIELGMVEVSIAIAGIAIGVATIIQNTTNSETDSLFFKLVIALFSAFLAIIPSYAALDLLARHEIGEDLSSWQRIKKLLFKKQSPHWLVGVALTVLLIFASVIGSILIWVSEKGG